MPPETSATITIEIPGKEPHQLMVKIPDQNPSNDEINKMAFLLSMMVEDAYPIRTEDDDAGA